MRQLSQNQWLLIAGLLGGLAEVVWVGLYALSSDLSFASVGTAVTATVIPASAELAIAPLLGLAIHMLLSVALAFGFGLLIWPFIEKSLQGSSLTALISSVVSLTIVWKINFFLLLPIWNPDFLSLMPMSVTFVSKALFGLAMGLVLSKYQKVRHNEE